MGPFKYDEHEEEKDVIELGPHLFENGAVYIGQWKNGLKYGKGR